MLDRALDALQKGSPTNIGADTVLKDSISPDKSNKKVNIMEMSDLTSNPDLPSVF
jgi:hypothetical protein